MDDDMRLPVVRVPVELLTSEGRRRASLFLYPGETLGEFLERDDAFFPAENEAGGIELVARDAIACVASDVREPSPGGTLPRLHRPIAVTLRSGTRIEGELESVFARSVRTLDLLNGASSQLLVHAAGMTHHVVMSHVMRVEEG